MTLVDKIKQLIAKAKTHNWFQEYIDANPEESCQLFDRLEATTLPLLDTSKRKNFSYFVRGNDVVSLPPYDTSNGENFNNACDGCKYLEEVYWDFSNAKSMDNTFSYCVSLRTIGEIDASNVTFFWGTFFICEALENITFKPNSIKASIEFDNSPRLTMDSCRSIMNGLAPVETEQTLRLHETTMNMIMALDDSILTIAYDKGWNVM